MLHGHTCGFSAAPKRHCIFILFSLVDWVERLVMMRIAALGRGRAGTGGSPERASAILVTGLGAGGKA